MLLVDVELSPLVAAARLADLLTGLSLVIGLGIGLARELGLPDDLVRETYDVASFSTSAAREVDVTTLAGRQQRLWELHLARLDGDVHLTDDLVEACHAPDDERVFMGST